MNDGLNRTFYGIETLLITLFHIGVERVLIVPFMELKRGSGEGWASVAHVLIVPFMELKLITTMSTTMSTTVLIVPFMELKRKSSSTL